MNTITAVNYDPYKYFMQMSRKHKGNWRALFIVPTKKAKNAAMRTLFNLLEDDGITVKMNMSPGILATSEQSEALFKVAFKGITDNLKGTEYQQIDGTEYLTKYDEQQMRELLRTKISIPLAKDMVIR